ncbi:MAG: histidine kinase dimerization/phospho-acceptor domain-containing protein [Vicinamibacterales bacterium]
MDAVCASCWRKTASSGRNSCCGSQLTGVGRTGATIRPQLKRVDRARSGVAHDFNNLLMVIQGNASLLRTDIHDAFMKENVIEIEKASERAAALTRQLLLFSRRQVIRASELDLNEIVVNMTKLLGRLLGEHIRLDLPLTDRVMPGDMSGRDLGERLRAEQPGLTIVYTSGYTTDVTLDESERRTQLRSPRHAIW